MSELLPCNLLACLGPGDLMERARPGLTDGIGSTMLGIGECLAVCRELP
jgi:hypothetical protein